MELNKWEKEFKEQLNSHEIKPSEQAWQKLDAMLSAEEKPKNKFPWMYAAASFVGVLLIGTVYFSQKENAIEIEKNEVVIQNKIQPNNTEKASDILDADASQIKAKGVAIVSKKAINGFGKTKLKEESITVKDSSNQNRGVVSINNQFNENDVLVNSSEKKRYESLSKNKYVSAEKLLAEVSNAKFEPKATDKVNEKTRRPASVDPNRLLSAAETELNQSYRESALDLVSKNFKAIKTVLASRNYEE